jgi:hypothetical protein
LQLIQRIDRQDDVGRPGQWKLGREVLPEPEIVILKGHPGRQFLEGEGRDSRITCASSNGLIPHPSVANPRCDRCWDPDTNEAVCPYAPWRSGPGGTRVRPPCDETHAFLIVIPMLMNKPAWLICAKTAMKPTREFIKAYTQLLLESGAARTCEHVIKLTSTPQQRTGGGVTYYIPTFTILDNAPEPLELYARMTDEVLGTDLVYLPRVSGSLEEDDVPAASAAQEVMGDGSEGDDTIPF